MHSTGKHNRHSIRLKGYDYSKGGLYFVTICVENKAHLLGEIVDGVIALSEIGRVVEKCWLEIPEHYPRVRLDEYVVMPNHIHGIIEIIDNVGAEDLQPLHYLRVNRYQQAIPRSLTSVIRGFKIGVTKWCNQHEYKQFAWQRNYYDHVVRHEAELNRIREYIINNPLQWQFDRENPNRIDNKTYDIEWRLFEEKMFGK